MLIQHELPALHDAAMGQIIMTNRKYFIISIYNNLLIIQAISNRLVELFTNNQLNNVNIFYKLNAASNKYSLCNCFYLTNFYGTIFAFYQLRLHALIAPVDIYALNTEE